MLTWLLALTSVWLLDSLAFAAAKTSMSNQVTGPSIGGEAKCISGTIALSFVSENLEILYGGPKNPLELTQLFQNLLWVKNDVVSEMIGKPFQVKGTYDIFVKLCMPKNAIPKSLKTVHVLTHGGGLDHTYWEMAKGYSYVDASAAYGFATLTYDRLGVGGSAHPDPLQVVQASAHAEVLHGLTQILRTGLEDYEFTNIVGIGHSFGSWFTQETATRYPRDFDALVLTGTSAYFDNAPVAHSSLQAQIANLDPSGRFKDLANGYIIAADILSVHQFNLYYYPHFDEAVLRSQSEARQTISLGEMLTLPTLMRPSTWSGPLDIVNGANDFVYCAGNCLHDGDQTAKVASVFFPNVGDNFSSFNLPNTGHNLPGHHRAQEAYDHIFDFLTRQNILTAATDEHSEL